MQCLIRTVCYAGGETICLKCGVVLPTKCLKKKWVEDYLGRHRIAIKSQEEILPGDIEAFLPIKKKIPIKKKMEKSSEKANHENMDNREYAEGNESWELIRRINAEMAILDGINEGRVNRGERKLTFFEHLDEPGQSELSDDFRKSVLFTQDIEELDRRIEKETKAKKEAEAEARGVWRTGKK